MDKELLMNQILEDMEKNIQVARGDNSKVGEMIIRNYSLVRKAYKYGLVSKDITDKYSYKLADVYLHYQFVNLNHAWNETLTQFNNRVNNYFTNMISNGRLLPNE